MNDKSTGQKVLIVEDHKATASDFTRVLEHNEFMVAHAVSAMDAIELAKNFRPDVVLLDLQIPSAPDLSDESVEHGLRTLDDLLREDPFRPICIVTAHSEREILRRAMQRNHGGEFIFKDDDIRRELPRGIHVALANPAYRMSRTFREFKALIEKNETEDAYRKFIQENWELILGPEYREVKSPYTIARGAEIDLLAVRWDDFADLWELKRPSDPIFKHYNSWLHHSTDCAKAIGQLMEYYDGAEKEVRSGQLHYDARHGNKFHLHRPRGFVVIGRYESDAQRERLRLENSFLAGIAVLTYDDLVERAEQLLHFLKRTSGTTTLP